MVDKKSIIVRHEKAPDLIGIAKKEMREQYRNEGVITSYNLICTFVNARFMVKHAVTKQVASFDTLEEAIRFMIAMGRI